VIKLAVNLLPKKEAIVKKILLLLVLITASSELFSQQQRYIRDELLVPLRSGQGSQYRIVHKGLISGTAVTVLETNDDKSYSRVKTRRGTEGWIQSQYLSDQPAGRDLLKIANKNIAKLEEGNKQLKQQLQETEQQERSASKQLTDITERNNSTSKELDDIKALSANAIQLNADNQRILEENQMLINKVEVLSTDNQRLNDNNDSDSFLNGAFAVLIGVMITLMVPRLWPKKSTDWA
jgi:SH3 domain protein